MGVGVGCGCGSGGLGGGGGGGSKVRTSNSFTSADDVPWRYGASQVREHLSPACTTSSCASTYSPVVTYGTYGPVVTCGCQLVSGIPTRDGGKGGLGGGEGGLGGCGKGGGGGGGGDDGGGGGGGEGGSGGDGTGGGGGGDSAGASVCGAARQGMRSTAAGVTRDQCTPPSMDTCTSSKVAA